MVITDETRARAEAVFARMREGLSFRKAAKAEGVPMQTVQGWIAADEDLAGQYARAREEGHEAMADEIRELADKPAADAVEAAQRRLQVDARKWLLSKQAPKRYGDKVEIAGDPSAPLAVSVVRRVVVDPKSHDDGNG